MKKRKKGFVFILLFSMTLGYLYPQYEINKKKGAHAVSGCYGSLVPCATAQTTPTIG